MSPKSPEDPPEDPTEDQPEDTSLYLFEALHLTDPRTVSLRLLAHLGDAVFHLYERERQITKVTSAKEMHHNARVAAANQAEILNSILPHLNTEELDVVRRARNLKLASFKKVDQSTYRQATAFETLLGFLYIRDRRRLREVLGFTEYSNH